MKLNVFLMASVVMLCSVACSDDEKTPAVADIAGIYDGYTLAGCSYFQNSFTANETVIVSENTDGTADIKFSSDSWGDISVSNAQMTRNGSIYTLVGSGQAKMGMGGNIFSYDCTCTAVISSKENSKIQFKVAGVMGGLVIDFITGEPPADLLIAGTYEGYTDADCGYFSDSFTDNESLEIKPNGDGTIAVEFESATWGTFNVAKATVTKNDDEYTFTGEGNVSMGMEGNIKEYAFTMTGTINAAKDTYSIMFNVPAVMGGLTVTLLPGTAPSETK